MELITIIYENEEIFIINKPSGLAVQGGQGVVHSVDRDFALQTGQKVFLVHRLDKDTSGLMIVAKNQAAAAKWTKLVASKLVKKEYAALCVGRIPSKAGVIKDDVIQHGETKTAVTHYQVEKEWEQKVCLEDEEKKISMTLVKLKLETGRMHQIRIHLAKNGCPIAGDDQHGNFKMNKLLKKACGIKRLQLAAVKLTVPACELDSRFHDGEKTFEIAIPFTADLRYN